MVKKRATCRVFLPACLLLFLLGTGSYQALGASPGGTTGGRVVAVFFSVDTEQEVPTTRGTEEANLLRSGLFTSLAANLDGYSFVLLGNTVPERRDGAAVAAGSDAWIAATLARGPTTIDVRVTVKDLYYENPGAALEYQIPVGAAFRGNTGRYWFPAVDFVESRLLSSEYETLLVVSGVPGTTITGLGRETLLIGDNGNLGVHLPFGEVFDYRSDAKGYHPVDGELRTTSPEARLFLSQPPRGRFTYEAFLTGFSYPGAGASIHLVPAWSMVRLDLFTYAFGIVPYAEVGGEEGRLVESDPVSHLTAWLLQHLLPTARRLRPYVGVGGSVRMFHTGGMLRPEPVSPYGATALLGLEAPGGYGAWFFEYAPLFYFVDEPDLWNDQFSSGRLGYLRIGDNALDLMMVRFGFRVTPPGWR
ncbi:MAG: hypothetical protein ACLFPV_02005 [Spirochaetaceae bacterium]